MMLRVILPMLVIAAACLCASAQPTVLVNPTKRTYADQLIRLMPAAPDAAFVVSEDGKPVPHQVEQIDGRKWIWVCSTFEPLGKHRYELGGGAAVAAEPRVTVKKEGDAYLLDNGHVAVRVPAAAGDRIPGPITAVRLGDGKWVGASSWRTQRKLTKFTATVIGDGTLFGKVRLRYDFEGMAGINGDMPAFSEIDVTVGPGWKHIQVFERHEMGRGDGWELEASRGWAPNMGLSKPFSGGPGSGVAADRSPPDRPLKPGGLPVSKPELFISLFPRWNQHYKDGWYFLATDGQQHVGAVVVSASKWVWPHNNSIEAIVREGGDYAGLRVSTWKGQRLWWLVAGPRDAADIGYVTRHAWEDLDKLNHEFVLDWPGVDKGGFAGMNFYDGGQINPTGGIRGQGRNAIANAGKPGDLSTLTRVQVMMHGDAYGSYWNYWSPENPNFFTDFIRVPIALTTNLKGHPRFQEFAKAAEMKLREDMYHSITLPGGAGQECPGYVGHGLSGWTSLAAICREHLGFDPTTWERYKAAQYFLKRISQPDGSIRRALPMGDTHPGKSGGPNPVEVPAGEVAKFVTEELPGFGVIFSNNPGTAKETYLAFKAGPNRGHYHGDQLAIHYCADAKPVAVDHHCSYNPRAGQEHMHNRLSFSTDKFPYANMDGYERLIAFKKSAFADVAIGQVESDRLRQVVKLPPEIWHQEYPQHPLARPLVYRRTVVLMKAQPKDYLVIRDQYWAGEKLTATYNLHVRSDRIDRKGQVVDFGNLTLFCAQPTTVAFESFPWSHNNGGGESTQGARLSISAPKGEFITVLYPGKAPAISAIPGGVKIGQDEVIFGGSEPSSGDDAVHVMVERGGAQAMTLKGTDIDLNRSQGEIGLFVPDAGYPFGEIPDWLIKQRAARPQWAK